MFITSKACLPKREPFVLIFAGSMNRQRNSGTVVKSIEDNVTRYINFNYIIGGIGNEFACESRGRTCTKKVVLVFFRSTTWYDLVLVLPRFN